MIKIFVNSERIEYYPKSSVIIEPGAVTILNCDGIPVTKYNVFVVSLGDGMARKDVRSICAEIEKRNEVPTLYCDVNGKTIKSEPNTIEEIKDEDMASALSDKKPDITIDLDFSDKNPLQEYFSVTGNQLGCLSGEDALVSTIENFRDMTWKDYVESLGTRSKEQLTNASSYDEAINYLASELSTMKSMVNEFLDSLKEKL